MSSAVPVFCFVVFWFRYFLCGRSNVSHVDGRRGDCRVSATCASIVRRTVGGHSPLQCFDLMRRNARDVSRSCCPSRSNFSTKVCGAGRRKVFGPCLFAPRRVRSQEVCGSRFFFCLRRLSWLFCFVSVSFEEFSWMGIRKTGKMSAVFDYLRRGCRRHADLLLP